MLIEFLYFNTHFMFEAFAAADPSLILMLQVVLTVLAGIGAQVVAG